MSIPPRLLLLTILVPITLPAQNPPPQTPRGPLGYALIAPAGIERMITGARMADDERTAAVMAADPVRLDAILSDELRYAHSNGKVDTKASFVQSLVSHDTVYESFDYVERSFQAAGPGIVLMTGRVLIHVSTGTQKFVADLNFLGVWREENGRWRFLSWQSSRNQPPAQK